MQVRIEEISPVEKRVHVEIEWPLVAAKLDEAYREHTYFSKEAAAGGGGVGGGGCGCN